MKVILMEDMKDLGAMGSIVQVKDGYARNFLFPKNSAKPATAQNIKAVDEVKKKKELAIAKERRSLEKFKEKLSLASCTVTVEAGEDDKLFGSVTAQDIASALEEDGYQIDKRKIELDEPIKKLGLYHVAVKLHPEVTAEVKVWVVKS